LLVSLEICGNNLPPFSFRETARADNAKDAKMDHKIFSRRFSNGRKETIMVLGASGIFDSFYRRRTGGNRDRPGHD
ncbi:MAG TPA: hypothetical protein VEL68_20570, partial [Thermodesulfobacteriota bacterium]|nr:hypothetical protein [Thermodesulfobacteriota bacterium]